MTPPSLDASAGRSRTVAILVILAVALGAGLAGAAIDRAYVHRATRLVGDTAFHPISSALREPTEADRARYRTELSEALTLTPQQNRAVDSIMTSRAGQFDDLRASIRPRVESLVTNVRTDIEQVLTPAQRDLYRKLHGTTAVPAAVGRRP